MSPSSKSDLPHRTGREVRRRSRWSVAVALSALVAGALLPAGSAAAGAGAAARGVSRQFPTWTGYEIGQGPSAVATGDFDGDGAPDVAYAHLSSSGNDVAIQLNTGDGTMRPAVKIAATAVSNDIAAADIDGDADIDLVVVSEGGSRTNTVVDLYRNDGAGHFTHATVTGGHGAQRLAVADLNADGNLDLAITDYSPYDGVSVLLGRGDGTFRPETVYPVGTNATGITAADLTGDGFVDLAVGWTSRDDYISRLTILANKGDGRFKSAKTLSIGEITEFPVVANADFDGDGRQDLVAAGWRTDQHLVLRNTGHLAFTKVAYAAGFTSTDLWTGDVDGDGHADVVSATLGSTATGNVSYLRNKGDGTFATAVLIDAGAQPVGAAGADFTGDGRVDLAVANQGSGTGSIHPQGSRGLFPKPPVYSGVAGLLPLDSASADFDGDGDVDMAVSELDLFSSGNDAVSIMDNRGRGDMTLVQTLRTGTDSHAKSTYASDLNGDGAPDLLWTPETFSVGPYKLAISMNDGKGRFAAPVLYTLTSGGTGHVTTADLDDDGDQDAIVAHDRGPHGVSILLNNGKGVFGADTPLDMGDFQTMAIGVDLNGDGIADIAAVEPQLDGRNRVLMVAFGKGNARFGAPVSYQVGYGPRELAAGDLDHDGDLDLVTANEGGDDISTYQPESTSVALNNGKGGFDVTTLKSEVVYSYFDEFAIALGDVDGNGDLDIAVAHPQGQNVGVYLGNGRGGFKGEYRFGVAANMGDVNLADYNGDTAVDLGGPITENTDGLFPNGGVTVVLNRG